MATAKNGMRFDTKYCRLTRFENASIVEVCAYPDSAKVVELFMENPV